MNVRTRLLSALAGAAMLPLPALAQTELTVYTTIVAEDLARYAEAFESRHPGIRIDFVRDPTGVLTAKLLAERDNPKADVIWSLAGTAMVLLKTQGMLEPYAPAGVEKLDPRFVDDATPPEWTGMNAMVAAVCFNTVEAARLGLPRPTSWRDLTEPVYRGHVAMPNPNSSGVGFLQVASWLQIFGEEGGWAFMDALHENAATYTHSGSKPCKLAGSGESPVGISFAFRGAKEKAQSAPIDIILPSEGIGWDIDAAAIVAGTDDLEAAKKLIDFSVTRAANEVYNGGYAVVAMPGVAKPVEHFPEGVPAAMIDNDFEWAANNRERILAEWARRYDLKTEPRG